MTKTPMLNTSRQVQLAALLRQRGELRLRDVIAEFGVARATAQRDLNQLCEQSWVKRTHGGVVLADPSIQPLAIALTDRQAVQSDAKSLIAKCAVLLLHGENLTLYIDSGTTTLAFANELVTARWRPIWVVTNSWHVAEVLSHAGIRHELLGGEVDARSLAISGPTALDSIRAYHFDWAILSADAITESGSVRVARPPEAHLKRAAAKMSVHSMLLAHTGKYKADSHVEIMRLAEFELWAAERDDPAVRQLCNEHQVKLVTPEE